MRDYLGKLAELGARILAAIKTGQHDTAWALLHEQQTLLTKHANQFKFGRLDTLTIRSGAHGRFAEILKKEGKHNDALTHILYMVASDRRRLKGHRNSLRVYFKRCKFKCTTLEDMYAYSERIWSKPNFKDIQSQVAEWAKREL